MPPHLRILSIVIAIPEIPHVSRTCQVLVSPHLHVLANRSPWNQRGFDQKRNRVAYAIDKHDAKSKCVQLILRHVFSQSIRMHLKSQ